MHRGLYTYISYAYRIFYTYMCASIFVPLFLLMHMIAPEEDLVVQGLCSWPRLLPGTWKLLSSFQQSCRTLCCGSTGAVHLTSPLLSPASELVGTKLVEFYVHVWMIGGSIPKLDSCKGPLARVYAKSRTEVTPLHVAGALWDVQDQWPKTFLLKLGFAMSFSSKLLFFFWCALPSICSAVNTGYVLVVAALPVGNDEPLQCQHCF